jgi:hypothetical protein
MGIANSMSLIYGLKIPKLVGAGVPSETRYSAGLQKAGTKRSYRT